MYKSLILVQLCLFTIIASSEGGIFDSIVSVNREDNGDKKVGVHLPFIYWMDLNRNSKGPKLDLSVLGGLVKVNVDRKQQAGKRPVMVRLLGTKIYNSYPENYGQSNEQANYQNEDVTAAKPASTDYSDPKPDQTVAQDAAVTDASADTAVPPAQ